MEERRCRNEPHDVMEQLQYDFTMQGDYIRQLEIERKELVAQLEQLHDLLEKHGICINCGEIFSHEIEEPFAHCGCGTSEWYKFTPYMDLEHKLYLLSPRAKGRITTENQHETTRTKFNP